MTKLLNLIQVQGQALVIAFRHHGCTFTREALSDLALVKDQLIQKGWTIVLVHMDKTGEFTDFAGSYLGAEGWEAVGDPDQKIYSALGFNRGSLLQVLGPSSLS